MADQDLLQDVKFEIRECTVEEYTLAFYHSKTSDPTLLVKLMALRSDLTEQEIMKLTMSEFQKLAKALSDNMNQGSILTRLSEALDS